MKLELLLIGVVAFVVMNIYHDGKYTKMLYTYKKHFRILFIVFLAILFYVVVKRNPAKCRNILLHANNIIKYMPIDKTSMDMLSPIIDFTSTGDRSFMESFNNIEDSNLMGSTGLCNADRRIVNSGKTGTKRSVSETKKKYVASQQDWKCGHCESQLDHTFEIDHRVRLEYGGGNDVQNLIALCRNCHGKKTASENM